MSLSQALRSLRRTPVFAITTALTLAIGIGSVGAAFAIAYGVLLAPLPYGKPDQLVSVALDLRAGEQRRIQQPPAIYLTYKRLARRFAEIGFYRIGNANLTSVENVQEPTRVSAAWLTASTIPLLQTAPILGRAFTADEDISGAANVAMISEAVWRDYFHASRDVVGKTLNVNGVSRVIVGVMSARFLFPEPDIRIWLPARIDRDTSATGDFAYSSVARLAPGATPIDAQRELASLLPKVAEFFPRMQSGITTASWLEQSKPVPVVVPLRDEVTHGIARTLWMLTAAAGLVLLVALANVANLMLIRADARQLELSVREALGASRLRVLTHFLGEAVVLATIGGATALVVSWSAVRALVTFGPTNVPRLAELNVSAASMAFVFVVSIISAIICTVAPTFRVSRSALSINLRDGGRGGTTGRNRQRLRSALVASQIAMALVVVAGSALLLRTFQRLMQQPAGFDASNVVTVWTQLPFSRYDDSASVTFHARLTAAVANIPGVVTAGVTTRVPLGYGEQRQQSFRNSDGRTLSSPVVVIGDGYFGALKIPLLAGRTFRTLGLQHDGEIILSRRAAATVFNEGAEQIIGRSLSFAPAGPTFTVVGVVGDVREFDLSTEPGPTIYMAQAVPIDRATEPQARRSMALVVRTSSNATGAITSIRRAVHDLDPTIPVFNVETMSDVVRASTARLSLTLSLMTAAATISLVLGMIGLYGAMTYMVGLRTRELGIRLALGADPQQLAQGVAATGLTLLAIGIAGGLALYALATPMLRGFVYGVSVADPIALVGATVVLILTATIASWLPAKRAAQIDPMVALRAE